MNNSKKPIVLVHGLWVTPLSWDKFKRHYEARGHQVLAPPWPGVQNDPAAMRRNASTLHGIGIAEVMDHYISIIRSLPEPPVIIGHSYGGLITQLLIDQGFGAAGVAVDSVPPKGVIILPFTTLEALSPAFVNPGVFGKTYLFPFKRFWRVFANTLPEAEAREAYEQQAIPASGRAIYQAALANVTPGALSAINFRKGNRAPLLFIAGEKDVIMPSSLNAKNFRKYRRSSAITDFKEFPGRSHFIIAERGWEEVAEHAIAWAEARISEQSHPHPNTPT